jgi:hypothetical protein
MLHSENCISRQTWSQHVASRRVRLPRLHGVASGMGKLEGGANTALREHIFREARNPLLAAELVLRHHNLLHGIVGCISERLTCGRVQRAVMERCTAGAATCPGDHAYLGPAAA